MRLWHENLLPKLDDKHILGQHRECCALRGNGWNRPHSTVNYVFKHDPARLVAYHYLVLDEMTRRGFQVDSLWYEEDYRGRSLGIQHGWTDKDQVLLFSNLGNRTIYEEHNDKYMEECLENLKRKGFEL